MYKKFSKLKKINIVGSEVVLLKWANWERK